MDNNRLGLIGSSLVIAGLFAPLFTVSLGAQMNFIGATHPLITLSVLAIGCIGIFACARNEVAKIPWLGVGCIGLFLASFAIAEFRFARLKSEFETSLAGNPFGQKAIEAYGSPQLEWGWLVLAVGAGMMLFASLSERKAAGATGLKPADQIDRHYALAAAVPVAIGLGMLGIGQLNSSGGAPNEAEAAVQDTAKGAAATAEANAVDKEKQDYIANSVEVYELDARYMDSMLDGTIPGVTFKVRNKGNRTLEQVEVTVEFLDADGNAISEEVYYPVTAGGYDSQPPLRPGHIWQNERGRFMSAKSVPSEWQSGKARAKITDIQFAKGETR